MRAKRRALLVGLGGLGCPAALVLAEAGVGTLGLVDDDVVELGNLHRQILYDEEDVGRAKVLAARDRLLARVPSLRVDLFPTRMVPENATELVSGFDVVLEGSDNFATKFLVADACKMTGVPVVHASAIRWIGTAFVVGARGRPCYRCLFEDVPLGVQATCSASGVMGPAVGLVAAVQADFALSLLDGEDVSGTLFTFDGLRDEFRTRLVPPQQPCALCGDNAALTPTDQRRYESTESI